MKKILIATTALVLTAGVAAADVALSGSARMGVVNDSANKGNETQFTSRVRISGTGSGTTDGGLTFGASYRFDQNGGNASGTANGDSTVYIAGAFGKITMGDVGGAADALVGQVGGVGLTGLGDHNEIGFIGTTKTAAYYEKSVGSLTFGLGLGQPGKTNPGEMSLGAKYATDKFSVALGYEAFKTGAGTAASKSESLISLKGSATLGAATVQAKYVSDSRTNHDASYALSVGGTFGGVAVTAFYAAHGDTTAAGKDGDTAIGLGASYDLGGGASVVGGVAQITGNATGAKARTQADVGVSFTF